MKLKYIFGLIIILKCVFLAFPNTIITPFPFADEEMREISAFTYVWALLDIASFAMVMIVMRQFVIGQLKINQDNIRAVSAFTIITVFDLVDFVIRGNSEWFRFGSYPVTNNVFMIPLYWFLLEIGTVKHDID